MRSPGLPLSFNPEPGIRNPEPPRWTMTKDWLAALDPEAQGRARELIRRLEALGAPRPEALARAEVKENHPHLTRFLLLRHCWTETIDPWRDDLAWVENLIAESE